MASVAKVYGRAFYEFAKERSQLEQVMAAFNELSTVVSSNHTLSGVLLHPAIDSSVRAEILKDTLAALKIDGAAKNMIMKLFSEGRLGAIAEVIAEMNNLADGALGLVRGKLKSSIALSQPDIDRLSQVISKKLGKTVRLDQETDPSLLGGFVASVAGMTYDASLRTQLNKIRSELK